mmetsp:Transcript_99951/g.214061  ORF Transcript_99951/g.214061 Transcript_99951/m.214061 type:complete len:232 (+) Transcript_99951:717-1412(+)
MPVRCFLEGRGWTACAAGSGAGGIMTPIGKSQFSTPQGICMACRVIAGLSAPPSCCIIHIPAALASRAIPRTWFSACALRTSSHCCRKRAFSIPRRAFSVTSCVTSMSGSGSSSSGEAAGERSGDAGKSRSSPGFVAADAKFSGHSEASSWLPLGNCGRPDDPAVVGSVSAESASLLKPSSSNSTGKSFIAASVSPWTAPSSSLKEPQRCRRASQLSKSWGSELARMRRPT